MRMLCKRLLDFARRDLASARHDQIVGAANMGKASAFVPYAHIARQRPSVPDSCPWCVGVAPVASARWSADGEQSFGAGWKLAEVSIDDPGFVPVHDSAHQTRVSGARSRRNENVRQLGRTET